MSRGYSFRSTLCALQKLIKDVSNYLGTGHIVELRKTPFWDLFDAFIEKRISPEHLFKSKSSIFYIMQTYQPRAKAFLIEGKETQFTAEDVKSIFGISDGDRAIEWASCALHPTESPFLRRRFRGVKSLTHSAIREALIRVAKGRTHEDFEDFARLLCLYALVTVFFATSGGYVSPFHASLVDDLESIKDFSWCKAIHGEIMKSIAKSWKCPAKLTGGMIAVLYWFCEKAHIMSPINREARPVFLKWSLCELGRALKQQQKQPALFQCKGGKVVFSNTDADIGNEAEGEGENGPSLEKPTLSPGDTIMHSPTLCWSEGQEFILHPNKLVEPAVQHVAAAVERDQLREKMHQQQLTLEGLEAKCRMLEKDKSKIRQQIACQEDVICEMQRRCGLLQDDNKKLERKLYHFRDNTEIQHNCYLQDEASERLQYVERVDEGEDDSNSENENCECDDEDES